MTEPKRVLVTGGGGYLASWLVKDLLEAGHHVQVTVQNKAEIQKYQALYFFEKESAGTLSVFEADLRKPESFNKALTNVEVVFHLAAPPSALGHTDNTEILTPLIEGTQWLWDSILTTPTVKKVVVASQLTSALPGHPPKAKRGQVVSPHPEVVTADCWNERLTEGDHPYDYGKRISEQLSLKQAETAPPLQGVQVVSLCAGLLLGPALSHPTKSKSFELVKELLSGQLKGGAPAKWEYVQDVRWVASCLMKAGMDDTLTGRYLLPGEWVSYLDLAKQIQPLYPKQYKLPRKALSKGATTAWLKRKGVSKDYAKAFCDYHPDILDARANEVFDLSTPPLTESLSEMIDQLKKAKFIR